MNTETANLSTIAQINEDSDLANLRRWMPEGSTVFTILRNVSRSGMQREIGLVTFPDGSKNLDGSNLYPVHPNYSAARVTDYRLSESGDGLVVKGCGMDMGWHYVTQVLSYALYGKPDALKQVWL